METQLKVIFTLAKFHHENVKDSDRLCTSLGHLGWRNTDRIISICVASTRVAKANTPLVAVAGIITLKFANGNTT